MLILMAAFRINVMNQCIVGYEDFYISELNDLVDIRAAYIAWLMSKRQAVFNIASTRFDCSVKQMTIDNEQR